MTSEKGEFPVRGTAIYFMLFLLPFFFACKETHKQSVDDTETVLDDTIFFPDDDPLFEEEDVSEIDIEEEDIPETESLPDNDVWDTLDEDGDGIVNEHECSDTDSCEDTDGDGTPDYQDTDSDGDGIPDEIEAPSGITVDTDNDGTPNFQDADSDNDGIPDFVEAADFPTNPVDTDTDGTADYRDIDSDNDGIKDAVECPAQPCVDSDGDETPDYLDSDSDNDTVEDMYEEFGGLDDPDDDGIPNYLDTDSDGDGLLDKDERGPTESMPQDTDGDNIPDFLDTDSDNDGLSDADEKAYGTDPTKADTDEDGIDDRTEVILDCDPLAPDACTEDMAYAVVNYEDPEKTETIEIDTPNATVAGKDLWEAVTFGITADDNGYGINALDFVQSSVASYALPAEGVQSMDGTSFYSVVPETVLAYELVLQNQIFENPTCNSELFKLNMNLFGDGVLIRTKVLLIIVQVNCPGPQEPIVISR